MHVIDCRLIVANLNKLKKDSLTQSVLFEIKKKNKLKTMYTRDVL